MTESDAQAVLAGMTLDGIERIRCLWDDLQKKCNSWRGLCRGSISGIELGKDVMLTAALQAKGTCKL